MLTSVVYGATGQTGSYLCEYLLEKGYKVIGVARRASTDNLKNLSKCLKNSNFLVESGDITDYFSVFRINSLHSPNELYNLAAQSHVGTSFEMPNFTMDTIIKGTLNCLEWLRLSPKTKFLHASSSEMFGSQVSFDPDGERYQDENTPMVPNSPYGIAKLAAHNLCRVYRLSYNLHATCSISFNHESPRRGEDFVTQKIIQCVKQGKLLTLGNIDSSRDWSHAKDIVGGMHKIINYEVPDDFVLGSGQTYTVHDFMAQVELLSGKSCHYTSGASSCLRPLEVPYLRSRSDKARRLLNWRPMFNFQDIVLDMLNA